MSGEFDDFFDDEKDKKNLTDSGLMPIVEVPSEASSRLNSARSEEGSEQASTSRTDDSRRYDSDEGSIHDDEDEDDYDNNEADKQHTHRSTSKSGRKPSKKKGKNGHYPVDMTPPDKLLKKAEKKAKRYSREKEADRAIQELIRCTALARIVYGDNHWKYAKSYVNLASGYLELKGYAAQAQYHGEAARSIMVNSVQTSGSSTDKANIMEVLIDVYYTLGRALTLLKKFSEAEQSLNKSEKIASERAKISSVTDDDIDDWDIKIFLGIAKLSAKQQKHAVAISYFEKALDLLEVKFGEDSTELIPIYQGMGYVEQSKGKHADHESAIKYFLDAHSIASKHYDNMSVELAETSQALAMAYSNVGEEDAENSAESYLNECLAVYQSTYGPEHKKTLEIQDELTKIMIRTDRQDEAISLLRSTLEPKGEVYGEYSTEVAETWKLIGSVYLAQSNPDRAIRALKKCLTIQTALHGASHKKCKDTQKTIDILMSNPHIAAKQKKSKADELKERPRFNSVVSRGTAIGGFKSVAY